MDFDTKGRKNRHIPAPIICNILLHLSVEEILICKRVCRAWHGIISERQFTELYFAGAARTDAYPLIRPLGYSRLTRELCFVDPKNYICDTSARSSLETKFKIPLYNFDHVLERESYLELTREFGGGKRKRCLKLIREDHCLDITNTCNGFLCLTHFNNVIISNPINGEFVNVPVPTVAEDEIHLVRYAFGFCPSTNNYKIIRIYGLIDFKWWLNSPSINYERSSASSAQINVFGSKLWSNIGFAPPFSSLHYPTYVNGTLYWLYDEHRGEGSQFIVFFDCGSDRFSFCELPSTNPGGMLRVRYNSRIGVLRDQFCFCDVSIGGHLDIWMMDKKGTKWVWTQVCNVRLSVDQSIGVYGYYQPITRLESGAIVLFHSKNYRNCGLIYYEPEMQRLKYFRILCATARVEAISYTPTFRSLKDVLVGNEVEVLNISKRCAKVKIQRENCCPIFLVPVNKS